MSCNVQLFRKRTSTRTELSFLPQRNTAIIDNTNLTEYICMPFFNLIHLKNNLIKHSWFLNFLGIFLHQ